MSSNDEDSTRYGVTAAAGVVCLVLVGVVAIALWSAGRGRAGVPASPVLAQAAAMAPAAGLQGEFAPPEKLYFAVGSDALPADGDAVLARVADTVRAQNGVSVLISGFHDALGDPQANAELAKRRAQAVRHALEANGVSPDRLVLSRPEMTTGGPDDQEARRVELRLR